MPESPDRLRGADAVESLQAVLDGALHPLGRDLLGGRRSNEAAAHSSEPVPGGAAAPLLPMHRSGLQVWISRVRW